MREKMLVAIATIGLVSAAGGTGAFAHGPQIQITNDGNKIATRNVFLEEHYNTFPAPATPATQVYVIPTGSTAAFGGTRWFTRPNPTTNSGPGLAWGYGWTYNDNGTPADPTDDSYTTTFPIGAQFVQQMNGELQSWNGASFVDAGAAQLHMVRGSGASLDFSVSGSADTTITYGAIAAPTAPNPDPHGSASYEILGNGIIPDASNPPAPVADGIYLMSFNLSLINQPPAGSTIAPSDAFHFVMFKGVTHDAALAAAQAAFPGASIQVVPEPTSLGALGLIVALAWRRRK